MRPFEPTYYRDTYITRHRVTGMYVASPLVGGCFIPLQADTLAGLKQLIRETLAGK